jgi:outer membrane protein OmpA-like peptidoglycan-associated protein
MRKLSIVLSVMLVMAFTAQAEDNFTKTLGTVTIGNVADATNWSMPYITWGGDVATFMANGGLITTKDSIFAKQGLNIKLTAGDDVVQQVRDYMSGKSPFLRAPFATIGLASEVIGSDPRTKGVMIVQMTWSQGDHLVVRGNILKTIADIKGRTFALQAVGPHVGMLDDILKSAGLTWDDIKVVWCKDLTGTPDSPAEMFRKDQSIDGCFVITPDMMGLCGDLRSTGDGAEGTVKDSRVLVSTAELSRSIADVIVCRKDFFDANKEAVTKFVAGYLKACEELMTLKKKYEVSGSPEYLKIMKMTQDIYGVKVIPTLENDAHGLVCDASFVGYPGNVAFFTEKGNLNGFEALQTSALNLATSRGYASVASGLIPAGIDYASPLFVGYLTDTNVERKERFNAEAVASEIEALNTGQIDEKTIYSFSIEFETNQTEFSTVQYGAEFKKVVELSGKYGNAVLAVRGHSDPTLTLSDLVKAGLAKGVLKRSGSAGNFSYYFDGKELNLSNTGELIDKINAGAFDGVPENNPRQTMQAALNLSRRRAEKVRDAIVEFATANGTVIDKSQIQPFGVGIKEPLIAKPKNAEEATKNMRVDFTLIRVEAEAVNATDFNF